MSLVKYFRSRGFRARLPYWISVASVLLPMAACGEPESGDPDGAIAGASGDAVGGGGAGSGAGAQSGAGVGNSAGTDAGRGGVGGGAGGESAGASGAAAGGMMSSGGSSVGGAANGGVGGAANGGVGGTPNGGTPNGGTGGSATGGAANGGSGGAVNTAPLGVGGSGFHRMEKLNRGLVVMRVSGGNFVSFRMFGFEHDPSSGKSVSYRVYRDGAPVTTLTNSTSWLDSAGAVGSSYTVRAVIDGVDQAISEAARPVEQPYLRLPLAAPAAGVIPAGCVNANEAYTYDANDGAVGDVDGNGSYELILKWSPTNSKDNSQPGCTGNTFIDAYTLTGKRLWRIDLGRNIRAGAHYTQLVVGDFDGDGKSELAVKTAPGTLSANGKALALGPAANDDDSAVYRNTNGYILTGPEYLTVFEGATGLERATVAFDVPRGTVSAWGDNYGNRVDRFLAGLAWLDGTGLPSFVMARGYYTRTTLTAWNYRGGKLAQLWKFDSNVTPKDAAGRPFTGQGSHTLTVANVDADPQQEIVYGQMTVDHDGKGLCSTGNNHGDALHVTDHVPSRAGIEAYMCNEDGKHPAYLLWDPRTCATVQAGPINGADTGRCVAGDVWSGNPGSEMWASSVSGLFSATTGQNLGNKPSSQNFLVWWDGDRSRELLDGNRIDKFDGNATNRLLTAAGVSSNNGTKSTPVLSGDILGDWREEVIWRESDNSGLRIYVSTSATTVRLPTLAHDPQYRAALASQNTAYNQPPHTSFHLGEGMKTPPKPNILVK